MAAGTTRPVRGLLNHGDSGFRFLAAACRWPDGVERRAAILAAAEQVEDWEEVFEHGRQHRVMPLMANALRLVEGAPPALVARAGTLARRNVLTAMAQTSEAIRIGSAFDAEGIDWLTFKGPTLAMLAYGSLSLKTSHDLDLLVDRHRIDQCFKIMSDLGYVRGREPDSATPEKIEDYYKDFVWLRKADGMIVELHTRFFDTSALMPGLDLGSPRALVTVGSGRPLPTLARAELLVYLAAHGARTSWHRIKWLADFAALSRQSPTDDLVAAHRKAADGGIAEILESAQLLSAELFQTRVAQARLDRRLQKRAHRLAGAAMRELTASHARTRRVADRPRRLALYLDNIRVARSWTYRRGELGRLLSDPKAVARGERYGWRGWASPLIVLSRFCRRQVQRLIPPRR